MSESDQLLMRMADTNLKGHFCQKCGSPLMNDTCPLCASMARLRQTVAASGGFKGRRKRTLAQSSNRLKRAWTGHSGVDSAVPNGDR